MIQATPSSRRETVNNPTRALFLLADGRECNLVHILDQIPPGAFDEIYLVDCGLPKPARTQAEQLDLQCITFPTEFQPGRLRKFCFDFARSQGLQVVVMFEVAHLRDLSALEPLLRLLHDETWDVVLGSRFEHRAEASLRKDRFHRSLLSRWQRVLGSLFFGRQFQDTGSDFLACRTHLLWTLPYHQYPDSVLFDWQFLSQLLVSGYRVGEIPIPLEAESEAGKAGISTSLRELVDVLGITCAYTFKRWSRLIERTMFELFPTFLGKRPG